MLHQTTEKAWLPVVVGREHWLRRPETLCAECPAQQIWNCATATDKSFRQSTHGAGRRGFEHQEAGTKGMRVTKRYFMRRERVRKPRVLHVNKGKADWI